MTKCQLQLERSQVSVGVVLEGVSTLDKVRIVSFPVWTVEIAGELTLMNLSRHTQTRETCNIKSMLCLFWTRMEV